MTEEKEKILAGIEVHVTLKTEKKVFNSKKTFLSEKPEDNDFFSFGSWELGYLGEIPFLNDEVINQAIKICSALNCKISRNLLFDRKIYSYFDLPKGFQITQEREPIGREGFLPVFFGNEIIKFPIDKVQIEEDTAKSFYFEDEILLDFRRSGNPLLEIVTKPVFGDVESLLSFAKQLRSLLIYLGISDAKMELGQFRIDMNFSFKKGNYVSPRYEVKNLNSFKNLRNSFDQLLNQQRLIFDSRKEDILSEPFFSNETLGYNESTQKIFFQREKTSYSYVEEYNLLPLVIEEEDIKRNSPNFELPWKVIEKFSFSKKEDLVGNTIFLTFVRVLKENGINYSEKSDKVLFFALNFLIPSINVCEKKPFLGHRKVRKIWDLLTLSDFVEFNKKKVFEIISRIFEEDDYYPKKEDLEEEKSYVSFAELEKESWKIIRSNDNQKKIKKILFDQSRIFSFVFGILKGKFPQMTIKHEEVKKISEEIWSHFNDKNEKFS